MLARPGTSALQESVGLVVVDNTNTKLDEYAFYLRTATRAGYAVALVELRCPDAPGTLDALHARNSHGVPLHVIRAMHERWEVDPSSESYPSVEPPRPTE